MKIDDVIYVSIETEMIIALLEETQNGPVSHEMINKHAKMTRQVVEKLLQTLQNAGLIYVNHCNIKADTLQRLRLATRALSLGADIERVSSFLQWQEFETMAALALEQNRYEVIQNLRFKHKGRRWEIDVVGCTKSMILCIDCKHWHHALSPSVLKKIAEEQTQRAKALAESSPNPAFKQINDYLEGSKIIPMALFLMDSNFKFYKNVPIVPILQIQDFLNQLPAYADRLTHFVTPQSHLRNILLHSP